MYNCEYLYLMILMTSYNMHPKKFSSFILENIYISFYFKTINVYMWHIYASLLMKDLIIGDVHFGVKSNSISWLEAQLKFFRTQVFSTIEKEQPDRIVFLGDVFDVRYSINSQVGIEVKNLFREMLSKFKHLQFYIVAGNHDYYSPLVEFEKYNAYELVFGEEFNSIYKNIEFITEDYIIDNGTAFLPWYWTEDEARWSTFVHDNKDVKLIYCHSDMAAWDVGKAISKGNATVYAGHIHYPFKNDTYKLYNVGACCALTFNDVNSYRYIHIVEDGILTRSIKNTTTPMFRRFYNEEIFTVDAEDFQNSFVQLCIAASNINKARYIEQIKEIKSTYIDCNIKVNVVDDSIINDMRNAEASKDFNVNISQYIDNNIPEHLYKKYTLIKERINS